MFAMLDRLREKPESYRISVTIIAAGILTAVIVAAWFLTLDREAPSQGAARDTDAGETPFATIGQSIERFTHEASVQIETFRELIELGQELEERER